MRKRKSSGLWLIKLIVFFILIVIALFGYALSEEMQRKNQIKNEINSLKPEAENIKKENMEMEERINYLSSKEYQEKEARERLNMQSPDEKVVFFSSGPEKKEIVSSPRGIQPAPQSESDSLPNYKKWWNYFFK